MLAICAVILVGIMVAIGVDDGGKSVDGDVVSGGVHGLWVEEFREMAGRGGSDGGLGAPPAEPQYPAGPTRLVIGNLATGDGEPEVTVTAAAVEPTRAIPEPTVAPVPVGDAVERWRPLVASIFPEFAVDTVLRVIRCESGGDPNATGHAGERGLLQIHPQFHADSTYDPEGNLRAGYRISSGGTDWSAWTCRP